MVSPTDGGTPTDRDALLARIEQTRDRLAATTDALAAKADVKGQAQAKVEDLRAQARGAVADARATVPGTGTQQNGAALGAVVAATALAVWLVARRR